MKPTFEQLRHHYPRIDSRESLFRDIGWEDLNDNKAFWDTCAIRMSYALLRAGVRLRGARMAARAGAVKGKRIEPGQARLSNILKREWGAPEVYKTEATARDGIGQRHGVVSFFKIGGADGGHIDLMSMGGHGFLDCARSCFFNSASIWFWSLR